VNRIEEGLRQISGPNTAATWRTTTSSEFTARSLTKPAMEVRQKGDSGTFLLGLLGDKEGRK